MNIQLIISAVIGGILGGSIMLCGTTINKNKHIKSEKELIGEYYKTENAVHVSPHSLRKQIDKGALTYILIDLRSAEEYEKAHIVGALNIPAYSDPDTSAYDEVDRIVSEFKDVISKNEGKDLVVYCYSTPCMTGRKIGKVLADHDIYVKHLGIGWNDWKNNWDEWNHEHEVKDLAIDTYITSGTEAGVPVYKENETSTCGPEGSIDC